MDDLNSVTLIGRLTADPELRSTRGGTSVCSFRLAFNSSTKTADGWEDKPNFINVTVWGSQGESCERFLAKGKQAAIKGRLEYREWETQGGDRRSVIEIVADRVQFIGPKDDATSSSSSRGSSRSNSQTTSARAVADDDDIPF